MILLAGDMGGTKCNLGLFEGGPGPLKLLRHERLVSHAYASAEDAIRAFLKDDKERAGAAAIAIAGPVVKNRVHVTNLPWMVDAESLARAFQIPQVRLLNDLEATAYSLRLLPSSDFVTLRAGAEDAEANQALLAAGTGLGEALLIWDGRQHVVSATEAGHCDFTSRNEREMDLLRTLQKRVPIASMETVLSGRGFYEIHSFLNSAVLHPGFGDPNIDPAPEITKNALDGSCPVCLETVRMWVEIYGAEAGNLALRSLARGGVYIAGGIAVKILPLMREERFLQAFTQKEKMESLLAAIPVRIVTNEEAPLWGAGWVASQLKA